MNLQSFKGTPDSLKWRFKGSERKPSLGAPEYIAGTLRKLFRLCTHCSTIASLPKGNLLPLRQMFDLYGICVEIVTAAKSRRKGEGERR